MGERSRQPYLLAAAVLAVAIAAAAGLLVGYQLKDDAGPVVPANDSVDAGFARDMQMHHQQAVEMSMIVRDNTDDEAVRRLAYDIALTQRQEIGQMAAWLDMWGLPHYSSAPAMAWMDGDMNGHMGHGEETSTEPVASQPMPGMATTEQMNQLRRARGKAAEILYLRLMIRHHQGGIDMARYAAEHAEVPQVRDLAQGMVEIQDYEINIMNDLLVKRGAEPIT